MPTTFAFPLMEWLDSFEEPTQKALRLSEVISACCEHRAWFSDHLWGNTEAMRAAVAGRLARTPRIWGVFRDETLVGILLVDEVSYGSSAACHFIFFDRQLAGRRAICLAVMANLFDDKDLALEVLRVELPEYASKLVGFLRKALGFRYENEDLGLKSAKRTSRKRRYILWQGKWHDAILLSITKNEFAMFLAQKEHLGRTENRTSPGPSADPDRSSDGPASAVLPES